jgi:PKD repeat protein
MENKIYALITAFFFCCLLSVKAQDSSSCTAHFQAYTSAGTAVSFRAQDTLPNIQHYWYFGDGTGTGFSRSNAFVVHVYQQNGTYLVVHVIRDSTGGGCFDSTAQYVAVNAPPSCPVYLYIQGDSTGNSHIYNFFASASGASTDTIRWYINDTLVGTGDSLLNRYFASGHYTICARLHTASGCSASACQSIDVVSGCAVSPVIHYSADSSDPQTLHFSASPDTSIYTYYWTFGDGGSSFGSHPVHTYPYGGTYAVLLRLSRRTGADSCTSSVTDTVYVTGRPTCNITFTYSQNPAHPGLVTFNAQDSTVSDSLTWVIQRPNDSLNTVVLHGHHPMHIFTDTGCYRVALYTTTPSGCTGMTQQWVCIDSLGNGGNNFITAYPNPAPGQTFLDVQLDEGHTINISIFNSMGHLVLVRKQGGYAGMNHIALPTASLPKGIYYVQIQYGGITKRSKIQKL